MKIEFSSEYYLTHIQPEDKRNAHAQALFQKLRQELHAVGIKENESYSLGDSSADDCFLLCKEGDLWAVSYLERGMKFRPAFFFDIDDAVHFFLWKLTDGNVSLSK